jgi:hypothetical protein
MREQILRQFFEGKTSAVELARDVSGSTRQSTPTVSITSVEDMDEDFRVTADMGVKLCDAVPAGDLSAESLRTIAFALEASDRFHWDGDEDAFVVINVHEEYTFLRFSNMRVTKQSLSHKDGHTYDIMVCKDISREGREVTAYFNVDIPTQSLRDALAN